MFFYIQILYMLLIQKLKISYFNIIIWINLRVDRYL